MGWFAILLVTFMTGALALVAAGFVMSACVGWYRISSFEGKSGYAVVSVAILGGFGGLILGFLIARTGDGSLVGIAWGAVLLAAGVAAAVARALADVPPTIGGQELTLDVEIRLPEGASGDVADLQLHSVVRAVARKSERGELRPAEARLEEGRRVVPGSAHVFTGRGLRMVSVQIGDEPRFGFQVPLPARPRPRHEEWSEWLPRPVPPNPPWPPSKPSLRFRVRRIA